MTKRSKWYPAQWRKTSSCLKGDLTALGAKSLWHIVERNLNSVKTDGREFVFIHRGKLYVLMSYAQSVGDEPMVLLLRAPLDAVRTRAVI